MAHEKTKKLATALYYIGFACLIADSLWTRNEHARFVSLTMIFVGLSYTFVMRAKDGNHSTWHYTLTAIVCLCWAICLYGYITMQ